MPDVIECHVPNCMDVPQKRWGWHWKQFERARFPSYNRNRSLFGRMLNQMYEVAVEGFGQALTFEGGLARAENRMRRESPEIIENTYRTAYENTAVEFAQGWRSNLKQLDDDDKQDIATLSLLAVRDYLTARMFQNQQQLTLSEQVNKIVGTHSAIAKTVLTEQARLAVGVSPGEPIPAMSAEDINKVALSARKRFRNHVTPKHSKFFSTTETVAASNLGILAVARAQMERSGQVLTKMWLSQRDARVRESHQGTDSQNIGLNGLFQVGNSVLVFPGDWTHGAQLKEIINCRCVLIFFSQN